MSVVADVSVTTCLRYCRSSLKLNATILAATKLADVENNVTSNAQCVEL
jgi:hypothetical protein